MTGWLLAGKQVRLKALIILLVGVILLGAGVHFLHAFQVKRNAQDLLDQALVFKQEKQGDKALKALEQYLGLVPSDNVALADFGFLLAQEAKTPNARMRAKLSLDQLLRRDPSRNDVRRKVAELDISLGQFNDARGHLKILLVATPDDPDLLHWAGRCEAAAKEWNLAADWYRKAIKIAPKRVDVSLEYALVLKEGLKSPGLAEEVIENLVKADPTSEKARLQVARYFLRADFEQAEQHLRYAMTKLGCETEEVYLLAGEVALARGKPEEARDILEQGRKKYPQNALINRELARAELLGGHRKEALAVLEPSLAKLSDDPDDLWSLANLLIDSGGLDQANEVIERLNAKQPGPQVECLQARVLIHEKKWGKASKDLEKTVSKIRSADPLGKHAYLLLAECYQQLGNPDLYLDACRKAVERDPGWPVSRRHLAAALAGQDMFDQAIQVLPDTPETSLQIARLLLLHNLGLPERDRRWKQVEERLANLPAKDKSSLEAKSLAANVLAAQKKFDQARELIEAERKRDPKQVGPWLFLIQLAELQDRSEEVKRLLDDGEKETGLRVEWLIGRLQHALKAGDAAAGAEVKRLESILALVPATDADRLRLVLAEAHSYLNHGADAERLWLAHAKTHPGDLNVRLRLLERFYHQSQEADLLTVLAEIRRIEAGDGPATAYGEAAHRMLQARAGNEAKLAEARTWLAKAATMRPTWSRVPLMEAESFDAEKLSGRALEKFKVALDRGERRLSVIRRVVALMYEQHLYAEATALLRKVPEQKLADAGLDRMAAQLLLINPSEFGVDPTQARKQALDVARKSVKQDSKEYRDFLWLGQIAALNKQDKEAESAFRRARDLNDAIPDTWAALILFLARSNAVLAEVELAKAKATLTEGKAALVLAPAYEVLGKLDLAEKHYEAGLTSNPSDAIGLRNLAAFLARTGQVAKAETSLRKLVDPQTKAPKDTLAWGRRTLALALASRGGYQRFTEAQKLLEDNHKDNGETLEDRFVKAGVLTTQPAHRQEAIKLCEELSSKQSSILPEVQFFLAQLYEADGNWRKAKNQLIMLRATQDKNPILLSYFTRALLRQGEVSEASSMVESLAGVAPEAWTTLELKARLAHAKGQKDKAKDAVLQYTKKKDARLDLAALLLDELGHRADAEKLLRVFVSTSSRPESSLLMAQHLAKHQQVGEALKLCEQAFANVAQERVVHCGVTVLRSGKGNADQQTMVEGWLTKAIAAQPKNAMLQILLAEVQDLRGRYPEAVGMYRKILQKDPDNIIALNNLAFLMAIKGENLQECSALMKRAIDIAGPQAQLLDSRAVILLQQGQSQQAIQDLQQAIAQGASAEFYFHLALAQHRGKNRSAAVEAWRKAQELGIQVQQVHPLEQTMFAELVKELDRK